MTRPRRGAGAGGGGGRGLDGAGQLHALDNRAQRAAGGDNALQAAGGPTTHRIGVGADATGVGEEHVPANTPVRYPDQVTTPTAPHWPIDRQTDPLPPPPDPMTPEWMSKALERNAAESLAVAILYYLSGRQFGT